MEPAYTEGQARNILLCIGSFWACWGLGVAAAVAGYDTGFAAGVLVGGVAGGCAFPLIGDGYAKSTGVSGATLMYGFSLSPERFRMKSEVAGALLHLWWWRGVTEVSGWRAWWVGLVLGGLLLLDAGLFVLLLATRA